MSLQAKTQGYDDAAAADDAAATDDVTGVAAAVSDQSRLASVSFCGSTKPRSLEEGQLAPDSGSGSSGTARSASELDPEGDSGATSCRHLASRVSQNV